MLGYFSIILFILGIIIFCIKREVNDIFIKILITALLLLIFMLFNHDIEMELLILLSSIMVSFFFYIKITRSFFLIVTCYLFIENEFYILLLIPIIFSCLIQDKNYFYVSYFLLSVLHIYLLTVFEFNSLFYFSLIFITLNFILASSNFTIFHPLTQYFLKDFYAAELILKNAHEEITLLQELPLIATLNLSYRNGDFVIKYITKASKNKKKIEKIAHQNITRLKTCLGDVELKIEKLDFKDVKKLKFFELKLDNPPAGNLIDYFNTLIGEIPGDFELFICYEDLEFNYSLISYNPSNEQKSLLSNLFNISKQNTQNNLTQEEQEEKICKARIILAIDVSSIKTDYKILKYKMEVLNAKRRSYLYNLIIFNRIRLNNLILASDYESTNSLVQKIPENEYRYINYAKNLHENDRLLLGHIIDQGIEKKMPYYIPIDALTRGGRLVGDPGTGKTYELASLVDQITKKRKDVGILIINLIKKDQYKFYKNLNYLRLEDLKIPYFPPQREFSNYDKKIHSKICFETSKIYTGALGLKNVFQKILQIQLLKNQKPSRSFEKVIDLIIQHLKEKNYSPSLTQDFITAVENRRDSLIESDLMDLFEYTDTYPNWFKRWLNGESFFIELDVSPDIQRIALYAILNLIRFKPEGSETTKLRNIIFIDEAHRLTSVSPDRLHTNDDELVTLNLQTEILANLLNEYRYQGISLIFSDQRVETMDYAKNVALKMYFLTTTNFTSSEFIEEDTLTIISHLKPRHSFIRFEDDEVLLKTPDFFIDEDPIKTNRIKEIEHAKKDNFKEIYKQILKDLS